MTFWDSATWHEYERLCGDEPGTRARLLASADFKTRVVDLSLSEAELWRGVRKSYRALIHKAEREYAQLCCEPEVAIPLARGLHAHIAGRETRSVETWVCMERWFAGEHGWIEMLANVKHGLMFPPPVAYAYSVIHGNWSYYFSAASLEPNINHALIWHAMKALKSRGVRYFELGWQGEAHDVKGKNIEYFRRGFGGFDIPAKEAPALCG